MYGILMGGVGGGVEGIGERWKRRGDGGGERWSGGLTEGGWMWESKGGRLGGCYEKGGWVIIDIVVLVVRFIASAVDLPTKHIIVTSNHFLHNFISFSSHRKHTGSL